ncbi:RING-H2 zinc finger protein RHA4a [Hibiscus syriacus]|uniref:RING-type E3 ubiquitin transferase n=1 Tax=Hibiscus syriacus TaxID=106335 RepID=A0A6A2WMJ4_HIBSY|nr:probable E3 ubiquitin-protein ligase RHA4A [Hibiscus syriacus]KAE8654870.1 RING-H2 zinc finger protein RHA4a [Hibiscus syriacus]
MGVPQAQPPPAPHLYPQALQLKLYQAFIFSIPILFSIILFLLFYLFFLKRRASTLSNSRPVLPTTTDFNPTPCQLTLEMELTDKLPTVLFDEELKTRDTQCSVCLGEFEIKEELLQLPTCKHVFHMECMHRWLRSNSTCPLCRCSVTITIIPISKAHTPIPPNMPS